MPNELHRVVRERFVFVEVATTQQRIGLLLTGKRHDVAEGIAERLAPAGRRTVTAPEANKWGIEMEIGEQNELHRTPASAQYWASCLILGSRV
jgi:hypothetical protein